MVWHYIVTNLLALVGKAPKIIVLMLLVLAFVVGSHAGLDALIAGQSGNCIHLDATHNLCVVNK